MGLVKLIKRVVKIATPRCAFVYLRKLYRKTHLYCTMLKYRGNFVWCPCCNGHFSSFVDFDFMYEYYNSNLYLNTYKNKTCPSCSSFPRHRVIALFLQNNLQKISTSSVLICSEDPIERWFDANSLQYTTGDLLSENVDIKIDILDIQFPNDSWSLIICNHVLEHVENYKKALIELKRVLTADGILILTVPTDRQLTHVYEDTSIITEYERKEKFGQADHARVFGQDFALTLEKLGFTVNIIDGRDFPSEIVPEIGPATYDDNRVYICTKYIHDKAVV